MRLSLVVPALAALAVVGCGSNNPGPVDPSQVGANAQFGANGAQIQYGAGQQPGQNPGQYNPGQYNPGQYGQPQQPTQGYGQPQQPTQGYGQPQQPTQPQQPAQPAASGAATPINASMLGPALTLLASNEVHGMTAEGGSFAGQFAEGQSLEQPVTLNPGKCYTVVGASTLQQLDISIVFQQAPLPPMVVAQSNTQGPQAVLGGKNACWKNLSPLPVPGKIVLKATRGAGMAAAQLYSK
jgi:hypothetical protein